ncbi:MAG TPA: hypothetical protein VF426_13230 [Marmoricola sp.]
MKVMAVLTGLVVALSLGATTPSYAAKHVLISGSGVGPYKMGTTGAKAVHSKLYTKPRKVKGCPIFPPTIKSKAARKSIGVDWSGKTWTKKSKINRIYVFGKKVGKAPIRTKHGAGVGTKVTALKKLVKHLKANSHLGKWVPVLSKRSGKHWLNFVVNNYVKDHEITSWSKLGKRPVSMIIIANKRLAKMPYGGAGGC